MTEQIGDGWLHLTLRRQTPKTSGRNGWRVNDLDAFWKTTETAIILVDVWDAHWSFGATERLEAMVQRMNEVVRVARKSGITIIHSPSDTMDFYRDHPARKWVVALPPVAAPPPLPHDDPKLPIDDSDHGSDTREPTWSRPWKRQHPTIDIRPEDAISDNGDEVYAVLRHKGIKNLIYMGVHTNMCILNRSFAIKRMVRWNFNVALARDLTDAMYNPLMPPYVSHEEGTQLVIAYIEKFWCPTFTSDDITVPR